MSSNDSISLKAGDSVARFFALGAECRAWRIGGRDMLWPDDPAIWPGVPPVLFPTCGWARDGVITVDGVRHPMPVHGFAAQSVFEIEQRSEDEVRFTLRDSAETRVFYPFGFELSVVYRLEPEALGVEILVANTGDST